MYVTLRDFDVAFCKVTLAVIQLQRVFQRYVRDLRGFFNFMAE